MSQPMPLIDLLNRRLQEVKQASPLALPGAIDALCTLLCSLLRDHDNRLCRLEAGADPSDVIM